MMLGARETDKENRMLRQARVVDLEKLPAMLQEGSGREYVLTSGFVQCADGAARLCDHARNSGEERLAAAIYERRLERLYRSWNGINWDDSAALLSLDRVEVPFSIRSTFNTVEASVICAGATMPELILVHEHVEAADGGIWGSLVQAMTSFKTHMEMGLRVSERALPEGTPVTIVAEAVSVGEGIALRGPPDTGAPFVISIGDGAAMKRAAEKKASVRQTKRQPSRQNASLLTLFLCCVSSLLSCQFFYWLSAALLAGATSTIVYSLWSSWDRARRIAERALEEEANRERALEIMARMGRDTPYSEDLKIEELLTCVVCMEKSISTVFLECGHMLCCEVCAARTKARTQQCPVCRQGIRRIKNIYLP